MSRSSATSRSLLALATLAIVLAGCAGDAPPTDQPGAPQSPAPSPTAAAAQPTPTEAATPTPATSPMPAGEATPTPAPRDPYDDRDKDYGPRPTVAGSPQAATVHMAEHPDHGSYLVGPTGHALYVFTQDSAGTSNCSGDCASAWPPLVVEPGETSTAGEGVTGTLATIERSDGSVQVTYDDAPLYYFASDEAPADTNGEGVGGVWFLAKP
jgi:predicted lipoprotein with Yx(FWY)xxD motif